MTSATIAAAKKDCVQQRFFFVSTSAAGTTRTASSATWSQRQQNAADAVVAIHQRDDDAQSNEQQQSTSGDGYYCGCCFTAAAAEENVAIGNLDDAPPKETLKNQLTECSKLTQFLSRAIPPTIFSYFRRRKNFAKFRCKHFFSTSILFIFYLLMIESSTNFICAAPLQHRSASQNNHHLSRATAAAASQLGDYSPLFGRRLRKRHIIAATKSHAKDDADFRMYAQKTDAKAEQHAKQQNGGGHDFAIKYLADFGYLSETKLPTPNEFHAALRAFQDMIGLPTTGVLDRATIELMTQPRCGNSDVSRLRERRKRFVYISRWENKMRDNVLKLSWFIENYTKDIPRAEIKKTVQKAFQLWSSQVKISSMESLSLIFEEATSAESADITILWAEGDHGDAHKFDGPGLDGSNILAHTFYPNYQSRGTLNGDIHLDDYERWHVNGSRDGASFPHVLVHEIGHTLGLGHSKKQQAIMYPIYRKEQLELIQLDLDDKCAINWSYIGASDLCLYIWLLSEVLPKKIAIEKDATYMIEDDNTVWDEDEGGRQAATVLEKPLQITQMFKRKLQNVRIPLCRSENHVRSHLERMLAQRLAFPHQLAQQYGEIVCRFLDGMQSEYGMPVTNNFHEVFRLHGVHNYFQDDEKFKALERSGLNQRQFDAEFFTWLTKEFVN